MSDLSLETFKRLLYAVHNIGGNSQPECKQTEVSLGARNMACYLFPTDPAWKKGAKLVVALYQECLSQDNPEEYALEQIQEGLNGNREGQIAYSVKGDV